MAGGSRRSFTQARKSVFHVGAHANRRETQGTSLRLVACHIEVQTVGAWTFHSSTHVDKSGATLTRHMHLKLENTSCRDKSRQT